MRTQPGFFSLTGEGLVVGRDSGDAVSREYRPPFEFVGGTIKQVTVDISGPHITNKELESLATLARE